MPDRRDPDRIRHVMFEMVMARASAIACGHKDAIDLDRLRHDPLMKVAVGRCPETGAALASQSTISRLENAPSKTEAARLAVALLDQLGTFVAAYDQRCNLYYSVAEVRLGLNKKAAKSDVVCVRVVWTEIDPELEARRAAETDEEFADRIASEIAAEKAKALARAKAHQPLPSIIVDSGNGTQAGPGNSPA
jgi:hypothetical protein